jgi:hypothetical protein
MLIARFECCQFRRHIPRPLKGASVSRQKLTTRGLAKMRRFLQKPNNRCVMPRPVGLALPRRPDFTKASAAMFLYLCFAFWNVSGKHARAAPNYQG